MSKQCMRILVIISIAGLALLSSACTRSLSTPPPTSTGEPGSFQQATMEAVLSTFLTQTAQSVEPPEGTPEPTRTPGIILEASITPEGTQPAVNVTTTSGTPTATGPIEHVVAGGEWLLSIARMYDVDPDEIIALNGLTPPYALFPGQILKIPVEGSITPEPEGTPLPGGTTYIVQAGDWVYSIARKFGVEPDAIISANNLAYPYTLYVGQELVIP